MLIYVGVIHKDPASEYGVCFPDFPGCTSAGTDLQMLYSNAQEALSLHIQAMQADGEEVPRPMSLEKVKKHPFFDNAIGHIYVAPELEAETEPLCMKQSLREWKKDPEFIREYLALEAEFIAAAPSHIKIE